MTVSLTSSISSLSVAVDCDDDGNKSLCAEHGVQGYPTIKVSGVRDR